MLFFSSLPAVLQPASWQSDPVNGSNRILVADIDSLFSSTMPENGLHSIKYRFLFQGEHANDPKSRWQIDTHRQKVPSQAFLPAWHCTLHSPSVCALFELYLQDLLYRSFANACASFKLSAHSPFVVLPPLRVYSQDATSELPWLVGELLLVLLAGSLSLARLVLLALTRISFSCQKF